MAKMNDKYIKNRQIIYQCTYCGTKYVNVNNCPNCTATSAASVIVADNLNNMLVSDLDRERKEMAETSKKSIYMIITIAHIFASFALVGILLAPQMLIVHLFYHIIKRKKPEAYVIIDSVICVLLTILIIYILRTY